jgi:hypothetical protein
VSGTQSLHTVVVVAIVVGIVVVAIVVVAAVVVGYVGHGPPHRSADAPAWSANRATHATASTASIRTMPRAMPMAFEGTVGGSVQCCTLLSLLLVDY